MIGLKMRQIVLGAFGGVVLTFLCWTLSSTTQVSAQNVSRDITTHEAKALSFEAIAKRYGRNVGLIPLPNDYDPGYYAFEIISPSPSTSIVIGHVAVDRQTGSVWDLAGACHLLISDTLRAMQVRIRIAHGISQIEIRRREQWRPNCDAP